MLYFKLVLRGLPRHAVWVSAVSTRADLVGRDRRVAARTLIGEMRSAVEFAFVMWTWCLLTVVTTLCFRMHVRRAPLVDYYARVERLGMSSTALLEHFQRSEEPGQDETRGFHIPAWSSQLGRQAGQRLGCERSSRRTNRGFVTPASGAPNQGGHSFACHYIT